MAASAPKTRAEPAGLVRIPRHIDAKLTELSEKTGRPKSWYARKALETYLEDMHDVAAAEAVLAKGGRTYTLDEVIAKLGLDR